MARMIGGAVESTVSGEKRVAVAFSGGVDSSVLAKCAARTADVVACAAFTEGAWDEARSRQAARSLGVELATVEVTPESAARELLRMDLPYHPTLMDRSLWCLYALVAQEARRKGASVILLGQLADELFGGYAKYEEALLKGPSGSAETMMDLDAGEYAKRGKLRETGACSPWAEPRFPYEMLADYARSLPISYKIRGGVRKAVLREAAGLLGVPVELSSAPKKAAQYSSGIQKLVSSAPFNALA